MGSLWKNGSRSGVVSVMTTVCNTHSPKSVTRVNKMISRTTRFPVLLNVYFLLAKKLKTKAMEVEMILAGTAGRPRDFSKNKSPKSKTVFTPPTKPNRRSWRLFFMMRLVIFLDEIQRTALGFVKNTSDVLTDYPETKQLNTTQEKDNSES